MSLYKALIDFRDNEQGPFWVQQEDTENVVKVKSLNNNNRGKSLLSFNFYQSEFGKLFLEERHDYNDFYMNVALGGGYGNYNLVFVDEYYMREDEWSGGYIYRYFNDDNQKKFQKILSYFNLSWANQLKNNRDVDEKMFKFVQDNFERNINDITSEYTYRFDEALVEGMREDIKELICNKFVTYQIFERVCGESYYTTVDVLLNLWKKLEVPEDATILDFFRKLIEENDLQIEYDLSEDYYSYYRDRNFDSERFNREVERNLDSILEKIEEDMSSEDLIQIQKFYKLFDKLKISIDDWNKFPHQKTFGEKTEKVYRVTSFEEGKAVVVLGLIINSWTIRNLKKGKMNYEEFVNFLYHPELFD